MLVGGLGVTQNNNKTTTVSFHNLKSQNFKLSVSNPKSKYVAYLFVLSQISNCQGLGRKNKHEILKTDRITYNNEPITIKLCHAVTNNNNKTTITIKLMHDKTITIKLCHAGQVPVHRRLREGAVASGHLCNTYIYIYI